MKAINKKFLCHEAVLITELVGDKFGNPSDTPLLHELSHVRFDFGIKSNVGVKSGITEYSGIMFFDMKNSIPSDVIFALPNDNFNGGIVKNQFLEFCGKRYTIVGYSPYYDNCRLHHIEVKFV